MSTCLGLRVLSHCYSQRPKTERGSKSHFGLEIRFIVPCEVARDFRKVRVRRIGVDVIRAERSEDDIPSTLRALQSRNRQPKRWLGQVTLYHPFPMYLRC
jgi:hypothetical protein